MVSFCKWWRQTWNADYRLESEIFVTLKEIIIKTTTSLSDWCVKRLDMKDTKQMKFCISKYFCFLSYYIESNN